MSNPVTITRSEISQLMKISPCTFDKLRRSGQLSIPPINWSGRPRWSRAAIAQWLGGAADMPDEHFALLTTSQVAEYLGIARSTAYRQLPDTPLYGAGIRLTSDIRYPRVAVINYVTAQSSNAA